VSSSSSSRTSIPSARLDDVALASTEALFRRWHRDGELGARDELIRRNLPLAKSLARRYDRRGQPLEDVEQVAALGLVKAVERFRPELGCKLATFAVPTILGEIKRYFRDTGWSARVPRAAQELALRVQAAHNELSARTGREPSIGAIALELELPLEDVLEAVEAARAHRAVSLDRIDDSRDQPGSSAVADEFGRPDRRIETIGVRLAWQEAIRGLPRLQRQALTLRFGHGLSQREIAEQLGYSPTHVSRILREATAKVHASLHS
jgi:RNA polymerase sigma-B factor